jgi:hypothetical protein
MEGYGVIYGDRPSEGQVLEHWRGQWVAGVHDNRWSRVLLSYMQQVGIFLCSSLKLEMMDGINVEQLVPAPTSLDPPLSAF